MIRKGKVIQIIPFEEADDYFWGNLYDVMVVVNKDLVVLQNQKYPNGIKGFLYRLTRSLRKNNLENIFPILMEAKNVKIGDEIEISCKHLRIAKKTEFYVGEE